jgi:preprotein translocase subunit SecE
LADKNNETVKIDKQKEKEKRNNEKKAKRAEMAKTPKRSPIRWLKEARAEFKKVTWPTRSQVINNTTVVLVILTISGIALWALDTLLNWTFGLILLR